MTETNNYSSGSVLASSTDFDLKFDESCHCLFCTKHFQKNKEFQSNVTNNKFKLKNPSLQNLVLNCNTENVIYLISCNKCQVQYVGQTTQRIKNRFSQHKSKIVHNKLNTFICNHFNSKEHSYLDCNVQIIDYIEPTSHQDKNTVLKQLNQLEDFWIKTLNSVYPYGLNDRISGFGDIRRLDFSTLNRDNTPFHYTQTGIHRRQRSHGKRKSRKFRKFRDVLTKDLIKDLLNLYSKSLNLLHRALKALSFKDISRINEYLGLNFSTLGIPNHLLEIIFAYTTTIRKPHTKGTKENDRMFCSIPFTHKIIDSLNLQSFFKLNFVKDMIPAECKIKEPPIISYRYNRNIGQSFMNYKSVLSDITLEDISNNKDCDCLCNNKFSKFVDPHHKHVFTGNLDIISDPALNTLMKKGTKFRVCPKLNIDNIYADICKSFDTYCTKWAKKEKVDLNKFDGWLTNIKRVLRNKLYRLKLSNNRKSSKYQKQNINRNTLKKLQNRFIFTNIDKAGNNFGIICKKYYIDVLKKELGINNISDIKGNDVYTLSADTADKIISLHKGKLQKYFNINMTDQDSSIPKLFWIPKLHKNPFKSRFIAGASKCTTKQLSVEVTLCLTAIRDHFRKYCNSILKHTGINCFWSINNSTEFLSKLKNLKAKSIKCFDFSTLYTNLPIQYVKEVLEQLIIKMFNHNNHKYINISSYTRKAFWSEDYHTKGKYKSYTIDTLISAVNFLLDNTYIQFGPLVFQQIKGIPMGSNCSPLLADLFLSMLEYQFMQKLMKKDFSLAKKLSFNARYIDDIACINIKDFTEIAKQIYPKDIPLEGNNTDYNRDVFLDLDIQVSNDRFITKVYHKIDDFNFDVVNYPFPDSNISERIGYNTFLSQVLRFGRICTKFTDFAFRVKFIYNKLKSRGYQEVSLIKYFYKFCSKYPEIMLKYQYHDFKNFKLACFCPVT